MHSLRCESGGDDGTDFGPDPDFFKHDFSGSFVGVDAPDFDRVEDVFFGDGSLGVTLEEAFREEAFHDDLVFAGGTSTRGGVAEIPFVNFLVDIPTKLEVPCGGMIEPRLRYRSHSA